MADRLTSKRKYLVLAHKNWADDNFLKPMLKVTATGDHNIPEYMVDDHSIVYFNISDNAVRNLTVEHDYTSFDASFNQKQQRVYFPTECILSCVAVDNTGGVADIYPFSFNPDNVIQSPSNQTKESSSPEYANLNTESRKRAHLKVVK